MEYRQFAHILFTTYRQWMCLLFGFLITLIIYLIYIWFIKPHFGIKATLSKTTGTINFLLFISNAIIVAGGLTLSLYALGISTRVIKMSPSEKVQLASSIYNYIYFFWMMIGILIAVVIIWFLQLYTFTRKHDNDRIYADFWKKIDKRDMKERRCETRKEKIISTLQKIKSRIVK